MAKQLSPDGSTSATSAPPVSQPASTDSDVGTNNRMRRAVCPTNPNHTGAKVYKTGGRTRYCRCDTCGRTWKQTAPEYTQAQQWASALAETLEKETGRPSTMGTRLVVVLDVASVRKIVGQLRDIAGADDNPAP
tara:strand:- start:561 stop:962 length:402 start_codon:yes stop_codon:yes gene_type:complete